MTKKIEHLSSFWMVTFSELLILRYAQSWFVWQWQWGYFKCILTDKCLSENNFSKLKLFQENLGPKFEEDFQILGGSRILDQQNFHKKFPM